MERSTTDELNLQGVEVNEAKRMRDLGAENSKLKKLLAERMLEIEALKDVLSKKW